MHPNPGNDCFKRSSPWIPQTRLVLSATACRPVWLHSGYSWGSATIRSVSLRVFVVTDACCVGTFVPSASELEKRTCMDIRDRCYPAEVTEANRLEQCRSSRAAGRKQSAFR